jgi:DNA-binding protein YbaB
MFDKIKQLKKIKELQDSLKDEKAVTERNGMKVVANGKFEIEEIKTNPELNQEEMERILMELINEAMRKVQMAAAQKMSQMGGLGL